GGGGSRACRCRRCTSPAACARARAPRGPRCRRRRSCRSWPWVSLARSRAPSRLDLRGGHLAPLVGREAPALDEEAPLPSAARLEALQREAPLGAVRGHDGDLVERAVTELGSDELRLPHELH